MTVCAIKFCKQTPRPCCKATFFFFVVCINAIYHLGIGGQLHQREKERRGIPRTVSNSTDVATNHNDHDFRRLVNWTHV